MHALPFISWLTRSANSVAAIPLGCLSVLVTWLNLMTASPASQAANTDVALNANVKDSAVFSRNFIVSSFDSFRRVSRFLLVRLVSPKTTGVWREN